MIETSLGGTARRKRLPLVGLERPQNLRLLIDATSRHWVYP